MNDNKHSVPHLSENGWHLDVYTEVEGQTELTKLHECLEGPPVQPNTIEGLRERLKSQKGY